MPDDERPPDWRADVVRAVWQALADNHQTARLAALLLAVALAGAAMTWTYQALSTPDTSVRVSVTVTNC